MTVAQFECHPGTLLEDREGDVSPEQAKATFGSSVDVKNVKRKQITCTLRFAKTSDVTLNSPGESIVPQISPDGIISARHVSPKTLFYKLTEKESKERENKVVLDKVDSMSEEASCPLVAVASKVVLPVLVHKHKVCIDVFSEAPIPGLEIFQPVIPHRAVTTSDLYTLPDIDNLIVEDYESGDKYARLVPGDNTEGLNFTTETERFNDLFSEGEGQAILDTHLPLCICEGEYLIAPIARTALGGANRPITTVQDTVVHAATLASVLSASNKSNSIGIAMQKITPGHQGDLMLHDGM